MGGEGSGRLPKLSTVIKKALEDDVRNVPNYFIKLAEIALNGDVGALQYLMDRHMGKPKQQALVEFDGVLGLMTASEYRVLLEEIAFKKIEIEGKLLTEGKDATE